VAYFNLLSTVPAYH